MNKKPAKFSLILLLAFMLCFNSVLLAACGGSGKKGTSGGDETPPVTTGWFSNAINAFKNAKLAPEFDDIMPGVINGSNVVNENASSMSIKFSQDDSEICPICRGEGYTVCLACFDHVCDNKDECPLCLDGCRRCNGSGFVVCQECWDGCPNCFGEGYGTWCWECSSTQNTVNKEQLEASTRSGMDWVVESFADMMANAEMNNSLYLSMFENSGLSEKGIWQEVGDTFYEWYIVELVLGGALGEMSSEEIANIMETLEYMISEGIYFKYDEANGNRSFYGSIPSAGTKIKFTLYADGGVETFISNDYDYNGSRCCDASERCKNFDYAYFKSTKFIKVGYSLSECSNCSEGYENYSYWEFEKVNGTSTGKIIDFNDNRLRAFEMLGTDDDLLMYSLDQWIDNKDAIGDKNTVFERTSLTIIVDGIAMTFCEELGHFWIPVFGDCEYGCIDKCENEWAHKQLLDWEMETRPYTSLIIDAKAFDNIVAIEYLKMERTDTWEEHASICAYLTSNKKEECDCEASTHSRTYNEFRMNNIVLLDNSIYTGGYFQLDAKYKVQKTLVENDDGTTSTKWDWVQTDRISAEMNVTFEGTLPSNLADFFSLEYGLILNNSINQKYFNVKDGINSYIAQNFRITGIDESIHNLEVNLEDVGVFGTAFLKFLLDKDFAGYLA